MLYLPSGRFKARVQIIFSEFATGEPVTLTVRHVATAQKLAETSLRADLEMRPTADQNYLRFAVPRAGHVEFSGHVARHRDTTLLRLLTVLDDAEDNMSREDFFFPDTAPASIADLKEVSIGTTGVCNASCVHCPTNKKSFHMPHGRMSDKIFATIIVGLKEGGFKGNLYFGLFAEPLEDPALVDRTKFIKELLPGCEVSIATNGALFNPVKDEKLFDYVDNIAIHVEAIDAVVYNQLMRPLKAERVMPKVFAMIELAKRNNHCRLSITTPVHKAHLGEVRALTVFCRENEIQSSFTALSSRAWEGGIYPKLTIAPTGGLCRPTAMVTSMFIDFDGLVLPCCFDFSRSLPLGDLNHQSFQEIFDGPQWRSLYGVFKRGEWSTKEACGRCRADDATTILEIAESLSASVEGNFIPLPTSLFSVTSSATRDEKGSIRIDRQAPDGIAIFGPYVNLSPGRYRAYHQIDVSHAEGDPSIELDACVNYGSQVAVRKIVYKDNIHGEASIDFEIKAFASVELRVTKYGAISLEHKGAMLVKL